MTLTIVSANKGSKTISGEPLTYHLLKLPSVAQIVWPLKPLTLQQEYVNAYLQILNKTMCALSPAIIRPNIEFQQLNANVKQTISGGNRFANNIASQTDKETKLPALAIVKPLLCQLTL